LPRRPPTSPLSPSPTLVRSERVEEEPLVPRGREPQKRVRKRLHQKLVVERVLVRVQEHGRESSRFPRGEEVLGPPRSIRRLERRDRKSTRLNSSHVKISYAV